VAKVAGLLYVVIGLIAGGFVSLFSLAGAAMGAGAGIDGAMLGALLGLCSREGVVVEGAECVSVSFPGFFEVLESLRAG